MDLLERLDNRTGFTILEVLLVIGIIVLLVAATVPALGGWAARSQLNNFPLQAIDSLRRAEARATSGSGNNDHGVHFESGQFVLFEGSTYSAIDPDNQTVSLPANMTISAISLTGGGADVIFEKPTGETTTDGTITFEYTPNGTTVTISVNELGLAQVL